MDSIQLFYPRETPPLLHYDLTTENLRIAFNPSQFTQVNFEINPRMIQQALEWLELTAEDRVLDLFCGIGNFTLPIAKRCQQVVGIEGDKTAVLQAQQNARANQLENVKFYVA